MTFLGFGQGMNVDVVEFAVRVSVFTSFLHDKQDELGRLLGTGTASAARWITSSSLVSADSLYSTMILLTSLLGRTILYFSLSLLRMNLPRTPVIWMTSPPAPWKMSRMVSTSYFVS